MTAVRFSPSEGAPNSLVSKPADNSVRQVCHLLSSASIYESRGAALQQLGGYMRGVSGGCFGLDREIFSQSSASFRLAAVHLFHSTSPRGLEARCFFWCDAWLPHQDVCTRMRTTTYEKKNFGKADIDK